MTFTPTTAPSPPSELPALTVSQLIARLADLEDDLRGAPALVVLQGRLVVNPDRRRLVARQRAVIGELRARRSELRSGVGDAEPGPSSSPRDATRSHIGGPSMLPETPA